MSRFILFLLSAVLLASCSQKVYQNIWQTKSVKVNGDASEWEIPLHFYDKNSTLQYTISNDSANIYFCFRAVDANLQIKILQAGMQIWIDTLGGQEKHLGLIFPFIDPNQKLLYQDNAPGFGFENQPLPNPDLSMANAFQQKKIKLIGFLPIHEQILNTIDLNGIKTAMNVDDFGILVYECAIPLTLIYPNFHPLKLSATMGITLIVNAIDLPGREGMMKNSRFNNDDQDFSMNVSPGGMPGRQMGGGMPGGQMEGGMMTNQMRNEPYTNGSIEINKQNTLYHLIQLNKR